jgi:hypothetical protein
MRTKDALERVLAASAEACSESCPLCFEERRRVSSSRCRARPVPPVKFQVHSLGQAVFGGKWPARARIRRRSSRPQTQWWPAGGHARTFAHSGSTVGEEPAGLMAACRIARSGHSLCSFRSPRSPAAAPSPIPRPFRTLRPLPMTLAQQRVAPPRRRLQSTMALLPLARRAPRPARQPPSPTARARLARRASRPCRFRPAPRRVDHLPPSHLPPTHRPPIHHPFHPRPSAPQTPIRPYARPTKRAFCPSCSDRYARVATLRPAVCRGSNRLPVPSSAVPRSAGWWPAARCRHAAD